MMNKLSTKTIPLHLIETERFSHSYSFSKKRIHIPPENSCWSPLA